MNFEREPGTEGVFKGDIRVCLVSHSRLPEKW